MLNFTKPYKPVLSFSAAVLGGIWLAGLVLFSLLTIHPTAVQAQEGAEIGATSITKTAYVVVRYSDSEVVVRRINFTGTISEVTALQLAGLNPTVTSTTWGMALAAINGHGNPADDPFGNNSTRYWATYHLSGTEWAFNSYGAGDAAISQNGHVEGFSWSDPGWSASPPPDAADILAADDALWWLVDQQAADGGFGSTGQSVEVLLALGANGIDPGGVQSLSGNPSLLTYLANNAASFAASGPAGAGKLALGLGLVHQPITNFNGLNLVISITNYYSPTAGTYSDWPGAHSWAMLGLAAASQTVPITAVNHLTGLLQSDGCVGWLSDSPCDTNGTALAVQALVAAGVPANNSALVSAVNWLTGTQNTDGGFPYAVGYGSDANSTAYVIQALLAAGQDPAALSTNPFAYLRSLQQASGQIYWQAGNPGWDAASPTRQSIPALLRRPFSTRSAAAATTPPASAKISLYYLPVIMR